MSARYGPGALPRIRDALIAGNRDVIAAVDIGRDMRTGLEWDNRVLAAAELWWVTAGMTRTALAASTSLPAWTPQISRPSECGLLVWDGGLLDVPYEGAEREHWVQTPLGARPPEIRVDAALWGPARDGLRISLLTRTTTLAETHGDRWRHLVLFPVAELTIRWDRAAVVTGRGYADLIAALGATWLLMQEPRVADPRPLGAPGAGGPGAVTPRAEVTIIDLRRVAPPPAEPGTTGRVRTHQWIVRGHWRQQACGPGRTQRRPTWIASHVRGPDGAPLLVTDKVGVWRR